MLNGLQLVLVHVPRVADVQAFYTDRLGLGIIDQQPGFIQFQPVGGGASLALSERAAGPGDHSTELWWFVDNADATCAELAERGVPIVEPLTDQPFGRTFTISDPAGTRLYMLQLAAQAV